MPLINDRIKSEGLLQTTSFRSVKGVLTDATAYMDSSSPYLTVIDSTCRAFSLPSALTIDLGHLYYVANDTTRIVAMRNYDATSLITLGARSRTMVALADNTTSAGRWLYESSASSSFASYSVYGFYGGNSNIGRYLEIYPGAASSDAPYIVVSPLAIVGMTAGATALATCSIGVFESNDLVNPIATISMANVDKSIVTDVFYPLSSGWEIMMRVTAGTVLKPYLTMYLAGI